MRNGYAHMALDHTVDALREVRRERAARLGALRTRKDAEAYRDRAREIIHKSFGPWPKSTPLNARVTGTLERPHYRVEKVIFESRPGCLVTGNLYVPNTLRGPAPAALGVCGHSGLGKAAELYQIFCQRLAIQGFVVFLIEPFSQGERDQYYNVLPKGHPLRRGCTTAHNMMGKQLHLVGEAFCSWRTWDGKRALDYLLSRPEVDPTRVGLTGNSGGGTMTTWIWPNEERLRWAAPSCFVTTFLANLENELPADAEQYPPDALGAGLEMADYFIARAPEPVILLGQHYDYFDRRGLKEAYEDIRRVYALFGAEKQVDLFIGSNHHGYHPDSQRAMVKFFCRQAGVPAPTREPRLAAETPEALWATPKGEVVPAGATPIFEMIAKQARQFASKRPILGAEALKRRVGEVLRLPQRDGVPHYRNLRSTMLGEQRFTRHAIETEADIRAILYRHEPIAEHLQTLEVESKTVTLYLPHLSAEEDITREPLVRMLCKRKGFFVLDARGLGESRPDDTQNFLAAYGMDYMMHGYAMMLGESYPGRRVHDVLRAMDLLHAEGATRVDLVGRGQGALLALFAAMLHPVAGRVTLKNAPLSCQAWAEAPLVEWPAANFVMGMLRHFDLPDLLRALGPRATLIQPWDARMKPFPAKVLKAAMAKAGIRTRVQRK